jgi:hypothetical protein
MRAEQHASSSLVSRARFPHVAASAGHYESFYLKACHPEGGLGVWIRYTVHKRPDGEPKGFVWFTLFDRAGGIRASKAQFAHPRGDGRHYIAMQDDSVFSPGLVTGRAPSDQLDAAWALSFEGEEPAVWHLPSRWMYRAPLPRTKVLSPHPQVVFEGWIDAGGRRIDVAGWPGTIGHNWGSEHAKRAIWLHGANFAGAPDAWLDLVLARVAIGPLTTPWVANGELCLDGRRHRLGGLGRLRSTRIEESVERCDFRLAGEDVSVDGTAGARREDFVGWIYAQPSGAERQTINCSIADLRLEVTRPARAPATLVVEGGAAYELQMEERYPPIPVQPFPDG